MHPSFELNKTAEWLGYNNNGGSEWSGWLSSANTVVINKHYNNSLSANTVVINKHYNNHDNNDDDEHDDADDDDDDDDEHDDDNTGDDYDDDGDAALM